MSAADVAPPVNEEADGIVLKLLTDPPQDPYPLYARLREIAPVYKPSMLPFWTVSTYDDVYAMTKEKRFIRDITDTRQRSGQSVDSTRPFTKSQDNWFVFHNPPSYQPRRKLYNTALNRSYMDSVRPVITKMVDDLLDKYEPAGQMEVINNFSWELTVQAICYVLGVPREDAEYLTNWAEMIEGAFEPLATEDFKQKADKRTEELEDYLHGLLERERKNPGDHLIGRLVGAEKEGLLTEEELMANVPLVFSAGIDTTTHFIGNAIHSFMNNRDQWELFKTDPEGMAKDAVEELIRYDSSVQSSPPLRLAEEDIELGGVMIPKGDSIIPFFGAAHHDPDRYENPEELDITRKDVNTLAFGGGLHICLGQHLARVESQIALTRLAQRFPNMELIGPKPVYRLHGANNRTLAELNLALKK